MDWGLESGIEEVDTLDDTIKGTGELYISKRTAKVGTIIDA